MALATWPRSSRTWACTDVARTCQRRARQCRCAAGGESPPTRSAAGERDADRRAAAQQHRAGGDGRDDSLGPARPALQRQLPRWPAGPRFGVVHGCQPDCRSWVYGVRDLGASRELAGKDLQPGTRCYMRSGTGMPSSPRPVTRTRRAERAEREPALPGLALGGEHRALLVERRERACRLEQEARQLVRLGGRGHVIDRPAEPEQPQRQRPLGARCPARSGPVASAGSSPALAKIDRIRAAAYCRYGPVLPVSASSRSKSST